MRDQAGKIPIVVVPQECIAALVERSRVGVFDAIPADDNLLHVAPHAFGMIVSLAVNHNAVWHTAHVEFDRGEVARREMCWPRPSLTVLSALNSSTYQLGIKLQAQKGQISVMKIDHVERPTAN